MDIGPGTVKRCRSNKGLSPGHGSLAWKSCHMPWTDWMVQLDITSRSGAPGSPKNTEGWVGFCLPIQITQLILTYMRPELHDYRRPLENLSLVVCFHLVSLTGKSSVASSLALAKAKSCSGSEKQLWGIFTNLINFPMNISRSMAPLHGQMGTASFIDCFCQILNTFGYLTFLSASIDTDLLYFFPSCLPMQQT